MRNAPINPLRLSMGERTCAAWSLIPTINHLILPYTNMLTVDWYVRGCKSVKIYLTCFRIEVQCPETGTTKWDGAITTKQGNATVCLLEFAGETGSLHSSIRKVRSDEEKIYEKAARFGHQFEHEQRVSFPDFYRFKSRYRSFYIGA